MITKVLTNYEEMSMHTADFIIQYVLNKPNAVLCLAGGDTPRKTYEYIVDAHNSGKADFSSVTFIGLDEFVGIGREDQGSCLEFLYQSLFIPMKIRDENIHFFDAKHSDLASECKRIDDVIFEMGGIDIILLGVGMNGHLGFNEPGVSFDHYSHVIDLDETSKTVGQKYFIGGRELSKGITLGIQHIMESKIAILIANGSKKANIIQKTLDEPVTNSIPSTVLKNHKESYLFVDKEASSSVK